MTTKDEALKAMDAALWRARAAAVRTSDHHIQIGHAIDAFGHLKNALAQPEQEPVAAAKKDEVFAASIEFIGTLTGMTPPPIEVAPPEVFKPFRDFTEKVCSILATPPQRKPLTDKQIRKLWAQHAAKQNGWPNDATPPMLDIGNGPRFQAHWHESEYQVFKAGFKAANGIKGEE